MKKRVSRFVGEQQRGELVVGVVERREQEDSRTQRFPAKRIHFVDLLKARRIINL